MSSDASMEGELSPVVTILIRGNVAHLTNTGMYLRRLARLLVFAVLSAGILVSHVRADTVRLADGTVLTGEIRQITDEIIEVKIGGKLSFIGVNRLHPEDRARFEKDAESSAEAIESLDAPGSRTLSGTAESSTGSGQPIKADTPPSVNSWHEETQDIPTLTQTAFSTDTAQKIREKAAAKLRLLAYDGSIDPLIEQLQTEDDLVAVRALHVMRRMPSERMLEPILERLLESRWQDRENVRWFAEILAEMGPSAVPRIIEASHQSDYRQGHDLIKAMGYLNDPRITERLIDFVESPDGGVVKEAAFASLVQIGSPEAVEAVVGPMCHAVETDTSGNLDSMWAVGLLGDLGDKRAVEPLIHALKRENEPSGSQYAIAESLAKLKDHRALGPLISKLRSLNMEMRLLAAESLGELGDPAALKPLMSLMVYLDADVRESAAEGIGKIGDLRTAGVLIGYLNACPGDDNTYEPLLALGEMGGVRVRRAIEHRISIEPSDGMTAYHGANALKKIDDAGTAEAEVSAAKTSLWHLCCWFGFLSRWLVIMAVWVGLMKVSTRVNEDWLGRKSLWFERFFLVVIVGLCSIRLLYVLVYHLNPGAFKLAVSVGMPLGRYLLCAVMDPLIVILTARGILRRKRWGWPLLFAYIPAAILLSLYDYGYWTTVMVVSAGWVVVVFGAWALAERLSRRPVKAKPKTGHEVIERSRITRSLLTALIALNSTRLLYSVAISVAVLRFFMTWGWDMLSLFLGLIAAAVSAVIDAAIMFLVNKLALKIISRARTGRAWLQYAVDTASGLLLGGLCILACGAIVVSAIEETGSMVQKLLQIGIPLFLIGCLSAYPVMLVWKKREEEILRYFVIITIVAYLAAQPLALIWFWTS